MKRIKRLIRPLVLAAASLCCTSCFVIKPVLFAKDYDVYLYKTEQLLRNEFGMPYRDTLDGKYHQISFYVYAPDDDSTYTNKPQTTFYLNEYKIVEKYKTTAKEYNEVPVFSWSRTVTLSASILLSGIIGWIYAREIMMQ